MRPWCFAATIVPIERKAAWRREVMNRVSRCHGEQFARAPGGSGDGEAGERAVGARHTFLPREGGRIPRAAACAGSLFRIEPTLDVKDDVRLFGRCRTRKRALGRLLEIMGERAGSRPVCVNLMHANVAEEAEKLKAELLSRCERPGSSTTDFTPVRALSGSASTQWLGHSSQSGLG